MPEPDRPHLPKAEREHNLPQSIPPPVEVGHWVNEANSSEAIDNETESSPQHPVNEDAPASASAGSSSNVAHPPPRVVPLYAPAAAPTATVPNERAPRAIQIQTPSNHPGQAVSMMRQLRPVTFPSSLELILKIQKFSIYGGRGNRQREGQCSIRRALRKCKEKLKKAISCCGWCLCITETAWESR